MGRSRWSSCLVSCDTAASVGRLHLAGGCWQDARIADDSDAAPETGCLQRAVAQKSRRPLPRYLIVDGGAVR